MPTTLSNPLRLGLRQERVISPQCLVIFGASGDLTHRKLIPALFELFLQRRIPSEFGIVGCARRPWTDTEFRKKMKVKLSNQISSKFLRAIYLLFLVEVLTLTSSNLFLLLP